MLTFKDHIESILLMCFFMCNSSIANVYNDSVVQGNGRNLLRGGAVAEQHAGGAGHRSVLH